MRLGKRNVGGWSHRRSPLHNPAENIGQYLRANALANTVFDSYDDILDKACDAWNFFAADKQRVASVTARTWATVTN